MAKLRKMLGSADTPCIVSLMRLIETQSKATISTWCVNYAEQHILQIYENAYPDDDRPKNAILAARDWLDGNIKLPTAKKMISECHAAARECDENPAAQAAARAVGQAASIIHVPTHSLKSSSHCIATI